ncbi:Zn(2)-Cys(6) binuclear cluster domain-containing protein [Mycena filopes]|nr:Zn(2)-Cys(6) binuclear cluster domain-containing protein [Mycena filopes]
MSHPYSPLPKGKACSNCRQRKTKCDGRRPMCGPCSRYPAAFGDCEYPENGLSTGQVLEEQIAILQARIEDLEKSRPQASGSHGHAGSSTSQISPSNTMALGPLLSHFYQQQTSGASGNSLANSMPTDLPFIVLQALVHNFLHNATCFGFFLDTQAFHDAVTSANGSGRSLPPVLLNVMYLWGVHLSADKRITSYEPAFLAHALRSTAGSLAGTHPRTLLHSAQASVLLAHYFLRNARPLEGRYHASAAVATVLSAGLHLIHGRGRPPAAEALPPPGDAAEEGERITAFWRVLTLNNCWAGVDGAPSNVSYGTGGLMIDTPWPLEARDYVERPNMLPRHSSGTVSRFLADGALDATSGPALHAKAGILFEHATRLGARYRASKVFSRTDDTDLRALDHRIGGFVGALPPVQSKHLLLVHTLAHAATIRLHEPLANEHGFARTKALAAARAIVDILMKTDVPKVGAIDPVLGPLWSSACRVLIAEVLRRRAQGQNTQGIIDGLNIVISAMQVFAPDTRLVATQLETVRRAYTSAQIETR